MIPSICSVRFVLLRPKRVESCSGVAVGSVTELAAGYGVRPVPNLLFFKNGEAKDQFIGASITKEQMRAKLEALM